MKIVFFILKLKIKKILISLLIKNKILIKISNNNIINYIFKSVDEELIMKLV